MGTTAQQIVDIARGWVGCKQGDATHKSIIDLYNTQNPLPRGYKVSYNDAWCATFVTAVFMKAGALDLIYPECGCGAMINGLKAKGIWIEDENRVPNVGDIVFYDWQDKSATGNNVGSPDHVGIVESVNGNSFVVIEGNYSTQKVCGRRTVQVNQRYLRGFATPKYDTKPDIENPSTLNSVNDIANEVVAGKWGSGNVRKRMLTDAGYNYSEVQSKVNDIMTNKKPANTMPENPQSVAQTPTTQTTKQGKVITKSGLNIRAAASIGSRKLGAIPYASIITITDTSNPNWYKVNWRGIVGYCSSKYIKLL